MTSVWDNFCFITKIIRQFLLLTYYMNSKTTQIITVGSQIVAHTLTETGNGPNRPNTINL